MLRSTMIAAALVIALASAGVRLRATSAQQTRRLPVDHASPTFSRDVAPLFFKHCTECHRPGEIAPMSLLTYADARPWARAIREKVASGAMPPWHADPSYGTWRNERRLTAAEKDTIVRWVAAGAPPGDPNVLPATPHYVEGWSIGRPDAIFAMENEFVVPAQGEIPYQYFEVPTNFSEDKWIQALEVRPGNRTVVHHILVYAWSPQMTRHASFREHNPPGPMSPEQAERARREENSSFLARTQRAVASLLQQMRERVGGQPPSRGALIGQIAPGTRPIVYQPGTAMLLQRGTILTFQIHYATKGAAATDRSSLGVRFASAPPTHKLRVTAMQNARFAIPAGAASHAVESRLEALENVTLYSLIPHTHVRGKAWEYTITFPDGRSETILSIPRYDFNWQTDYVFATPFSVPKGSMLRSVAYYDNSRQNKANPDPTQIVYRGDQTWEEMQYTGLLYSIDNDARPALEPR